MVDMDRLPKDLLMRRPTQDDLKAVTALVVACDLADDGMQDHTEEMMKAYWESPNFSLAQDAWLVETLAGKFVAYADVDAGEHTKIDSFVRVLPAYRGQGIETHLLQLIERRILVELPKGEEDRHIKHTTYISSRDKQFAALLEREGFQRVRSFWSMEMVLENAPQAPIWPEGVAVRTLNVGQDEHAVYELVEEAFQDHWGHEPITFEEFEHWRIKPESFDPSLWFLAFAGDKLVGTALCRYEKDVQTGWLAQLAVLRPWRRQGLGTALLLQFMNEFYRRGIYKVGLGVDAQNTSGATRLYERAGMHIALQHDTYEKVLCVEKRLTTHK